MQGERAFAKNDRLWLLFPAVRFKIERMLLTCPHCHGQSSVPPNMAGQVASCPYCQLTFAIPRSAELIPVASGQALLLEPESPEPIQQPQIIVVHSPSRASQPRMRASGWFVRSFASTSGVLMAICLFVFGIPAAICAGALLFDASGKVKAARDRVEEQQREEMNRRHKSP